MKGLFTVFTIVNYRHFHILVLLDMKTGSSKSFVLLVLGFVLQTVVNSEIVLDEKCNPTKL